MSKRLGKGLGALIPSIELQTDEQVIQVPAHELRPNPYQPRKEFDQDSLNELKNSIEEHGIIQPIIIRKSIKGYEIVAGERRFRAAKEAGLKTIPAVVKELTDADMMEIALIENVQREDLNALEVAVAYQNLMERFQLTQEALAKKVGKSRPHVANFLRLLQLPDNVQEYVSRGTLSMGHARALLAVKERKQLIFLAKKCIDEGLSVRQLETLVQEEEKPIVKQEKERQNKRQDMFLRQYEEQLRDYFGTSVKIKRGEKKGKIEIEFFSAEDLERIIEILNKES